MLSATDLVQLESLNKNRIWERFQRGGYAAKCEAVQIMQALGFDGKLRCAAGELFELYVLRYLYCPACGVGRFRKLQKGIEAVDLECKGCGIQVQCKHDFEGPHATVIEVDGGRATIAKIKEKGAKNLWMVHGTRGNFEWYRYDFIHVNLAWKHKSSKETGKRTKIQLKNIAQLHTPGFVNVQGNFFGTKALDPFWENHPKGHGILKSRRKAWKARQRVS